MVALAETEIGDGEKLTSPAAEAADEAPLLTAAISEALGFVGEATGFGADFATGLATIFGAGFLSAAGTPFLMGVSKAITFAGVGLGDGLATGVLVTGAFGIGALSAGVLTGVAAVRVMVTDFAHTVTEVGPVLEE